MPEFILSFLNNRFGKSSGVDNGESQFVYEVGNRSHVIHMSMADYKSLNPAFVFFQIFGVRYDEVNTRRFLLGKLYSGVYDDDFVAVFNDRHIAAYFFHSADGDYPDRHLLFFCLFFHKILLLINIYGKTNKRKEDADQDNPHRRSGRNRPQYDGG